MNLAKPLKATLESGQIKFVKGKFGSKKNSM